MLCYYYYKKLLSISIVDWLKWKSIEARTDKKSMYYIHIYMYIYIYIYVHKYRNSLNSWVRIIFNYQFLIFINISIFLSINIKIINLSCMKSFCKNITSLFWIYLIFYIIYMKWMKNQIYNNQFIDLKF